MEIVPDIPFQRPGYRAVFLLLEAVVVVLETRLRVHAMPRARQNLAKGSFANTVPWLLCPTTTGKGRRAHDVSKAVRPRKRDVFPQVASSVQPQEPLHGGRRDGPGLALQVLREDKLPLLLPSFHHPRPWCPKPSTPGIVQHRPQLAENSHHRRTIEARAATRDLRACFPPPSTTGPKAHARGASVKATPQSFHAGGAPRSHQRPRCLARHANGEMRRRIGTAFGGGCRAAQPPEPPTFAPAKPDASVRLFAGVTTGSFKATSLVFLGFRVAPCERLHQDPSLEPPQLHPPPTPPASSLSFLSLSGRFSSEAATHARADVRRGDASP